MPARADDRAWRYHVSPLGNPAPLFSRWRREGDEAGLATELHVPGADPARDCSTPTSRATALLYGPIDETEASLHVVHNGTPVPRAQIRVPPARPLAVRAAAREA